MYILNHVFVFFIPVCSVRPSTITEECRVPDGMVGLSEYIPIHVLNQTCLLTTVTHVQTNI